MRDVHILKNVAYAAKVGGGVVNINELDQLAPGAFAIVCEGTLVATTTVEGDLAGKTTFDLYVGVDNGSVTNNDQYPRATLGISRYPKLFTTKAYAAGTAKVMAVGYNGTSGSLGLPGTLVPGTEVTLKVHRSEIANQSTPLGSKMDSRRPFIDAIRVNHTITSVDTVTTIINTLVGKINNHPQNQGSEAWIVAANVSNTGISLTAVNKYQDFGVAVDDGFQYATVSVVTPQVYPVGDWRQAAELEQLALTRFGDSNRVHLAKQYFDVAAQANSAVNYETISIAWDTPQSAALAANSGPVNNELTLFATAAATARADYLTVLNTVILQGAIV